MLNPLPHQTHTQTHAHTQAKRKYNKKLYGKAAVEPTYIKFEAMLRFFAHYIRGFLYPETSDNINFEVVYLSHLRILF